MIVKDTVVNFGTINEGEQIEISWDLLVPGTNIVHISPDCGCTANVRIDKDNAKIHATFTEEDARELTAEQKAAWYPSGRFPVSKTITLYMNDGKDLTVLDNNNNVQLNPEKKTEKIGFAGYCTFKNN